MHYACMHTYERIMVNVSMFMYIYECMYEQFLLPVFSDPAGTTKATSENDI